MIKKDRARARPVSKFSLDFNLELFNGSYSPRLKLIGSQSAEKYQTIQSN